MRQYLSIRRETLGSDLTAGLTVALVSIPEGMAYALVAGVNPIYGLYTGMVTTVVASFTLSTSLMVVTLTNALALVTAEALSGLSGELNVTNLFALTFLVGVFMFVLGALRLGSIIRYVSSEVMSAFVFTTAFLIVLGQLGELVGYHSELDAGKFLRAVDVLVHVRHWSIQTTVVGALAIAVLLLMKRVKAIEHFADALIIVFATVFVITLGWTDVGLVGDVSEVPRSLPLPVLPDFRVVPMLLVGALAATVVGLSESAGIGAAYPNKDGRRSDMSKDFTAQGLANLVGSFFQAMPAAGSLSRTAINVSGDAATRWSGIWAGLLMAAAVVLIGPLAELIPLTGLAGLLIVIGAGVMVKVWPEIVQAWRVDRVNGLIMFIVVSAGCYKDLTVAIFVGVALSIVLYAVRSAARVRVVEVAIDDSGRLVTSAVPEELPSNAVTVVEVLGSSYFAAVYSLDDLLPSSQNSTNAVLIIRERHGEYIDATLVRWLTEHADSLRESGNLLMMSGVSPYVMERLEIAGALTVIGKDNIFPVTEVVGASTRQAIEAGEAWVDCNRTG